MKTKYLLLIFINIIFANTVFAQFPEPETKLDRKIMSFLEENANNWSDMNIPLSDGKILYDIIVQNGYKNAVEIGTSTGHSAIWIAWALSKTGGKLITIEIDKKRYLQAKANFKKAGVSKFIVTKLADAHDLVPQLKGSYDFVFCDADKYWYKNYFVNLDPKLKRGGCFVAHSTTARVNGIENYLNYVESLTSYETILDESGPSGMSISYKK